jgi:hypothetical protein
MADWSRPFDDPIPVPDDRTLLTLKDSGDYITSLPKAEQESGQLSTQVRPECWRTNEVS